MRYFKLFLFICLVGSSLVVMPTQIKASEPVIIEMLSRKDCTHCQEEKAFFEDLSQQRNDYQLTILDLSEEENQQIWNEITQLDNLPKVTPITLIGSTLIQGFDTPETTGKRFEELLDTYQENPSQIQGFRQYIDSGGSNSSELITAGVCTEECSLEEPTLITIPFIGPTNLSHLSLPVLASVLGFVDGFNPCAMWVLVTFLLILAQLKSRKKMLTYAGLFIIAEAIMYTLILTVWYTAWDFVGLDRVVTPLVGIIAWGGGLFFLYEWKTSDPGECKVTNLSQRQKIRQKIQNVIDKPLGISTAIGIIFIAFSVNVIEFACSVGIPQTFTKIIEINQLDILQTAFLIGLYIFMYMVDDFIVFGLALYSFEKIGLTSKYSKLSNLLGGILLLFLGTILIVNPSLLHLF